MYKISLDHLENVSKGHRAFEEASQPKNGTTSASKSINILKQINKPKKKVKHKYKTNVNNNRKV